MIEPVEKEDFYQTIILFVRNVCICLLQELFVICPTMPWGEDVLSSVETNGNGWITLQGFLAQWT